MKNQKYHLYLSDDEYRQVIQSLVRLKNNLISQGRYTDGVDQCSLQSAFCQDKKAQNQIYINMNESA